MTLEEFLVFSALLDAYRMTKVAYVHIMHCEPPALALLEGKADTLLDSYSTTAYVTREAISDRHNSA